MPIDILPFQPALVPQAGRLLASRHDRDQEILPMLAVAAVSAALAAAWQRPATSGVAALRDGQLVGYMLGSLVLDPVWGRSGWIRPAGCALARDQDPELMRDLYAALAAPWVDQGIFSHFVLVPTADRAMVDAWFSLSFGIQQVHALLSLSSLTQATQDLPPGVEIRRACARDRDVLARLSSVIWQHQVRAPVWGIMLPEAVAERAEGWAELVDDPQVTVWLALLDGEPVGCQGYWAAEASPDDILIPGNTVELAIAATVPWARSRGIGRALTRHGLAQAAAAGYDFCETDWRSTNLQSSRFWPRQGFQPVAYRLIRRVDPRIAWARGMEDR